MKQVELKREIGSSLLSRGEQDWMTLRSGVAVKIAERALAV